MNRREENIIEIVDLGIPVAEAIKLQKIARRLQRLDEENCNYSLTPEQETEVEKLEQQAQKIAGQKYIAYHQGDPRGWPIWIVTPDKKYDYIQQYYDRGVAVCPHR